MFTVLLIVPQKWILHVWSETWKDKLKKDPEKNVRKSYRLGNDIGGAYD